MDRFSIRATGCGSPPSAASRSMEARRSATVSSAAPRGVAAANLSRKRFTYGSRGKGRAAPGKLADVLEVLASPLEAKSTPGHGRPARQLEAMHAEERDRETVHAEGDATRVRH